MKPYGVDVEQYPDVADLRAQARKSGIGTLKGKSGDHHDICRGPQKDRTRRYWKRKARRDGRRLCRDGLKD